MIVPDYCLALNNMTIHPVTKIGDVIEIRAFEKGFYPTRNMATQEFLDDFNFSILEITKAQSDAMESASMFGWQCYKSVLDSNEKKYKK